GTRRNTERVSACSASSALNVVVHVRHEIGAKGMDEQQRSINRRRFVECLAAAGIGSTLLPGALAAVAQDAATVSADMLQSAMKIAGLSFTAEEQTRLLEKLNGARG